MPAIPLQQMDDFLLANTAKYDGRPKKWQDISVPLQAVYYQTLTRKAKPEEQSGALVQWDVQYNYDDNFATTGPHDPDVTSRTNTLTQGKLFWSFFKTNYTYDLREDLYNKPDVQIIKWLDEKEHGLDNSFFLGMEKVLFGTGPSAPNMLKPPLCSFLWWLPAYSATTGYTLATGSTSDFLGLDPTGFSSVGTGGISRTQYPGWRHRVGTYNVFSEDDAIDTIIECMDKCTFTPAKPYPELVPSDSPDWQLLTTYSRLKLARKIAQSSNDNLRGELAKWKDAVVIRGVPMTWVPAWTNQTFGTALTDGTVLGINWRTWKLFTNSGLNMMRSPPERDKDNHLGRWRFLDHSAQLACQDSRQNFRVTYGGSGTIAESN